MSEDFERTVTLVQAHLSARQKRAGHSSKTFTKTITLRQDGSVGISEYDSVRTVDMKAVPFDGAVASSRYCRHWVNPPACVWSEAS